MACPCFASKSGGDESKALGAADAVAVAASAAAPDAAEMESRIGEDLTGTEEAEAEVQGLSYESLVEMATDLWRQATQYLLPEEAEEVNEQHAAEMQRMNTLELREHVVAGKDVQAAVDTVVASGEASVEDVAKGQRASLNAAKGTEKFDGDHFASVLATSITEDGKINAMKFLEASNAVPLLVGGLGRAFEFAMADLNKKLTMAQLRLQETAAHLDKNMFEVTLQDMVERDIEMGTTHAGKKAAPAARIILRLMWFFDFTAALLKGVAENQNQSLKTICSAVYEDTLAPRHIWVLRRMARSGMRLLPDKQVFRVRLGTQDLSKKEESAKLLAWAGDVEAVCDVMWDFMKEKGLEELP